jgi:Glucodextranase, domain N
LGAGALPALARRNLEETAAGLNAGSQTRRSLLSSGRTRLGPSSSVLGDGFSLGGGRVKGLRFLLSTAVAATVAAVSFQAAQGPAALAQSATAVPDGPGALSHFDLARKDCVGTARNTSSKVWFTIANGVLSDVYSPTVDNTNVETLQYVVTDGSTFTDLQARDMTYAVRATDRSGMACQVTSTARSGKYRLVTDYITDPAW